MQSENPQFLRFSSQFWGESGRKLKLWGKNVLSPINSLILSSQKRELLPDSFRVVLTSFLKNFTFLSVKMVTMGRFKKLKNQRGSTLAQTLISVAVLGIATLGFATMMSNMNSAQSVAQSRQDLSILIDQIRAGFSSKVSCEALVGIGTQNFDRALASQLKNGLPLQLNLGGDILRNNEDLKTYSLTANRIELVGAENIGSDVDGNEIYKAHLIGQFSPRNSKIGGLQDFSTRVMASGYFTVQAGKIISCGLESPRDLDQVSVNCGSLGGTYDMRAKKCRFKLDSEELAEICTAFGGTYNNPKCNLGNSGGGGGIRWTQVKTVNGIGQSALVSLRSDPDCASYLVGGPGTTFSGGNCPALAASGGPCTNGGEKCVTVSGTGGSISIIGVITPVNLTCKVYQCM